MAIKYYEIRICNCNLNTVRLSGIIRHVICSGSSARKVKEKKVRKKKGWKSGQEDDVVENEEGEDENEEGEEKKEREEEENE